MSGTNPTQNPALPLRRLVRFAVTTQDTERLVDFWASALDCREVARLPSSQGRPGRTRMALGSAMVDILEFDTPGRPYPASLSPFDSEFQHFAIVVSDMAQAYERLRAAKGWTAITNGGPQRLPDASGGVTAFKFRDPDGHPLELLSFPTARIPPPWRSVNTDSVFLGIDHSALSVCDLHRSLEFYKGLGLKVATRSYNHGIEQERLDGLVDPHLDVIGLASIESTPHVELLFYRNATRIRSIDIRNNDVFASRLIFEGATAGTLEACASEVLVDPDGHRLEICSRIDS